MVRIAYFGTDGCPGHHVIPIRGKFTEEDVKVIESTLSMNCIGIACCITLPSLIY